MIGGNIIAAEAHALALRDAGADAVKVGVGRGIHLHHAHRHRRWRAADHGDHLVANALKGEIPLIADPLFG